MTEQRSSVSAKRPIVLLVGPMGAGKSTIGRLLASELHWPFRDTDRAIEERTGADIPWIFDVEGEAGFRRREADILTDIMQDEPQVVATGGGIVLSEDNRERLRQGHVVYLQATLSQLMARTAHDKNRPLLRTDDPEAVLKRLLVEREPLYTAVADLVVATDGRYPKSVAREIASWVRDWRDAAGAG